MYHCIYRLRSYQGSLLKRCSSLCCINKTVLPEGNKNISLAAWLQFAPSATAGCAGMLLAVATAKLLLFECKLDVFYSQGGMKCFVFCDHKNARTSHIFADVMCGEIPGSGLLARPRWRH